MRVTCAGAEHDDLGETVEADNSEVVTRVDEIFVDLDKINFSFR